MHFKKLIKECFKSFLAINLKGREEITPKNQNYKNP